MFIIRKNHNLNSSLIKKGDMHFVNYYDLVKKGQERWESKKYNDSA
jgi:hypothetical protein